VIRTIVIVGANAIGCRLAGQLAGAGYRTILEDLSGQYRGQALAGVEVARDLHRVAAEADLLLEAAPDDFETKFEVYTLIDRAAPPRSIFASTSPAWPVSEIASFTYRSAQVLGLWVQPDDRLEVVPGPETSAATLEAVNQVAQNLPLWNAKTFSWNDKTASGP
jgi:3-hydroxybutyryl-CoA dehydrogenase